MGGGYSEVSRILGLGICRIWGFQEFGEGIYPDNFVVGSKNSGSDFTGVDIRTILVDDILTIGIHSPLPLQRLQAWVEVLNVELY